MGLNNDRGERIPKSLINVPESVEVIRANGPVFTLGQEFTVTLLRKKCEGVGSLGGWSDGHKNWHAHRSPSVAMIWHCHDTATVINLR